MKSPKIKEITLLNKIIACQPRQELLYLCHLISSPQESSEWYCHDLHLTDEESRVQRLAYDTHPANGGKEETNSGPFGSMDFLLSLMALRVAACVTPQRPRGDFKASPTSFLSHHTSRTSSSWRHFFYLFCH